MMAGGGYGASPALLPLTSSRPRNLGFTFAQLFLWAPVLLAFAAGTHAAELHGRVTAVADGDTITVVDAGRALHKVRLAGIDAPEKNQPYGGEARRHLSALVFGKAVVVTWNKRDRYGRLVGRVGITVSGVCGQPDCARVEDVGLTQVESGLAWHYRQFQNEQLPEDRRRYTFAEQEARTKREGLWRDAHPVPPWEYRGSRRAAAAAPMFNAQCLMFNWQRRPFDVEH